MQGDWGSKPIASVVQKIAKECEEAGCNAWTVTKVVKEISKEEGANEKQLRKKALELLNNLDPSAAKVYASFQRMLVRTSRQTIEPFDRGNIILSLLKETDVTRGVAEKIGHEVEDKIKDLEISHVSTALIREMVNVKLLEYGHENIRNQYARLGLPVFDVKRKARHSAHNCKDILTEYNLLRVIPRKLAEQHLHSNIFIGSLDAFSTKPIAYCHLFEAKENLNETIFFNLKRMNRLSRLVAWPVNASRVNIALLRFAGKRTLGKAIELFLKAFESTFFSKTSVPRSVGLNLFLPENIEEVERSLVGSSANIFLRESAKMRERNTETVIALDTKYRLKLLGKNSLNEATLLNCRDRELMPLNGIAAEQNLCSLFGLNLAKAAASGKEQKFLEGVEGQLKAAAELAELKKNILAKREYLKRADIDVKKMQDAVGLYGLFSAATEITQSSSKKEILQFAEKTVSRIAKHLGESFVLTELLNKTGIRRFEAENKKKENMEASREVLSKSSALLKGMQMSVRAKNKKEANDLIEKEATLIYIG